MSEKIQQKENYLQRHRLIKFDKRLQKWVPMHYIPELKLGYDQLPRPPHKTVLHNISNTLRIACVGIFRLKGGTVLLDFFPSL